MSYLLPCVMLLAMSAPFIALRAVTDTLYRQQNLKHVQQNLRPAVQLNRSYAVAEVDTTHYAVRLLGSPRLRNDERIMLSQAFGPMRQFMLASIDTIVHDWVYLNSKIDVPFDATQGLQLTTVYSERTYTLDDSIISARWDGMRGGIVAIECADTLFISGTVNVAGLGFRGGRPNESGEGIEHRRAKQSHASIYIQQGGGRASGANGGGGGGGLASNGGGGGGWATNTGSGMGSHEQGIPGMAIATDDAIVEASFGGGGGAGHQDDAGASSGGAGGGMVFLHAPVIISEHGRVYAMGQHAPSTQDDGGGGGGAGGTIILHADTLIGMLHVDVSGGNGADATGRLNCYGAGGGGSGGRVILTSTKLLPSASILVARIDGGVSGRGSTQSAAQNGGAGETIVRVMPKHVLVVRNAFHTELQHARLQSPTLPIGSVRRHTPTMSTRTLVDPWGGDIKVEHFSDNIVRVVSSAQCLGAFDVLGKRLESSMYQTETSTTLMFETMPRREVFLAFVSDGRIGSVAVWLY